MCVVRLRDSLVLLALLLVLPVEVARADAWELIEEAQAASARDDHEGAIELYRKAIVADPAVYDSIGVPLAAQLTWAGRYGEAIREFKSYLAHHLLDTDAMLTYALAQFWDDRLDDALKTYRCVLHQEPDNPDAAFGEARMLAWQGKLDRSLGRFESLLRREPGYRDAAVHHAMVINWIGDHRRASRLYGAILEEEPRSADALYGRAQAWNAFGLADRAVADLTEAVRLGPNADEAPRLLDRIRRSWSPGLQGRVELLTDSDDFQRIGTRIAGGLPVAFRARPALIADRYDYSKRDRPTTDDLWVGLGGEARISEEILLYGTSQALVVAPEGVNATRGRGSGRIAWLPNDRVRVDLGYVRDALFTYERSPAFEARYLDGDIIDVGLTMRPYWRTRLTFGHDRGSYSDGNRRTNCRIRARYDLLLRPILRLEVGAHWLDYDEDRGGGIWTPQEFRSFLLAPELEWPVREGLRLLARLETGTARDRFRSSRAHFTAVGGFRFQRSGLDLELEVGKADADVETGRGYRRSFATLTAGVRLP